MKALTSLQRPQRALAVLVAQLLGGGALGWLTATVAGLVAARLVPVPTGGGMGDLVIVTVAATIGFVVGAAVGVALFGRLFGRHGSFWLALLGALVGGLLVLLLAEPLRLNQDSTVLLWSFSLASLALATAGYYLRRSVRAG